nr:MAG TPA: hypothetical protein [Caudoviricetes sp.]
MTISDGNSFYYNHSSASLYHCMVFTKIKPRWMPRNVKMSIISNE